jgi:hypothetical protein
MNLLKHHLSKDYGQEYLILQYAHDTVIILLAESCQLFVLKRLLISFSDTTCLKVNYNKSFLVPINIYDGKTHHQAKTIGCNVGTLPFTYLGLPL